MSTPIQARGFSLIELMIALVISSLLLTGLVTTFSSANQSYLELTKTGRQIENGRYALATLDTDLRHAGFYGEYTGSLTTRDPASPPLLKMPQPCSDEPADLKTNLIIAVFGYDGGAAAPLGCLTNYKPGTDVLVVRRVSTQPWPAAMPLAPNLVYFQGYLDPPVATGGPYLDYGTEEFALKYPDGATPVPVRQYLQHIYFISSCRDCSGGGDGIPTLTRLEFTGHGGFDRVPLAEGIERMRIRYGVDNSGLNNGAPAIYKGAAAMVLDPDWDSVMAVEVSLLARNNELTRDHVDNRTYQLGDLTVAATNDGYRRHAFTQVVRLTNPAARRADQDPTGGSSAAF